jgi:hypothetical protein
MIPNPNPDPDPELELKLPDLSQWWLSRPSVPIVEMTREEFDARRAEMAPWTFEFLDASIRAEQDILAMLKKPACSRRDRKNLLSALNYIRDAISIQLEIITDWGLTRPPSLGSHGSRQRRSP